MKLNRIGSALVAVTLVAPASAQWSSDAATNLALADAVSDQAQPKVVATADGGCYISWLDGIGSGWDVRLQRLDADGNEQFPHNGVLVADRSFSSTQDYGLDVDASGAALLAFRDDNFSPVTISAQRVSTSGVLIWGAAGIQTPVAAGSVAAPKIAGTANGDAVVAWTESSDGSTRLMRLLPNGATAWPAVVSLLPAAGRYSVSDLHGSSNDVILSMVHQTGVSFLSPKHLVAHKLDASGALLWGATPVKVFDTGSLQIGNFPSFVPDGSGGAVFSWYTTSPLQCYAQRLLADGSEAFPHNGSAGSTDLLNTRVSPSATFDPASSALTMYWEESDGLQSDSGLYGQRFDATGNAQWGATGMPFVALSSTQINWVRALTVGARSYVFWIAETGFGNATGQGAVVDAAGTALVGPQAFASTSSGKTRLAAARSTNGDALLAWSDDRVDANDILAQNFGPDGSLGVEDPADGPTLYCTPKLSSAGCTNVIGSFGPQQNPVSLLGDFFVTCSNVQAGKNGLLFAGLSGPAALPFNGGLLCVTPPTKRGPLMNSFGTSPSGCDGSYLTNVNDALIPDGLDAGPGNTGWYQYWYRDPQNGLGNLGTALSNAIELDFL